MKGYTVRTWADGFGRWHARIDGVEGAALDASNDALRARARRAIVRELQERQAARVANVRLAIAATDVTHDSRLCSITYAERTD